MKRMLRLAALAAVLVAFAMVRPAPADAAGPKVTICHIPPGNPGNAHTITVSVNAMPAHLAHGDVLALEGERGRCFLGGGGPF